MTPERTIETMSNSQFWQFQEWAKTLEVETYLEALEEYQRLKALGYELIDGEMILVN